MGSFNRVAITKMLYESGQHLFSSETLKQLFQIESDTGLYPILDDLLAQGVLEKLESSKYVLSHSKPHQFALANFLYDPSYVSFESALSFHGILPQFPFEITSATPNKSVKKRVQERHFTYVHLKSELYWGFSKHHDFLMAEPEKALLDQLYLISKGLKSADLDEYDCQIINSKRLAEYLELFVQQQAYSTLPTLVQKVITL